MLIPTFILQSFVENSVKYGLRRKEGSSLLLSAQLDEQENNMVILEIRDNGDGYCPEVLEAIGHDDRISGESEENIGIRNVKERLNIIYGNKAAVRIYNDSGAVSEIKVPLILQE